MLIRTRMAADALGATKLHRPEWISVDPRTKDVYVTLTNGIGAPTVSRRDSDTYGSIVRWREKSQQEGPAPVRVPALLRVAIIPPDTPPCHLVRRLPAWRVLHRRLPGSD